MYESMPRNMRSIATSGGLRASCEEKCGNDGVEVRLQRETDYVRFVADVCTDRGVELILHFTSADRIQVVASWTRCVFGL